MLGEVAEIEPVDDAYGAVSATATEDGADAVVVEEFLEECCTVAVDPCELVISIVKVKKFYLVLLLEF